jgi:hypothetical protein
MPGGDPPILKVLMFPWKASCLCMSRFPYSPVLLKLRNTLGSWSSQVGLPCENPLDGNWVALPCENPLVQEPPLLDICNPVNFRQSCAKWNAKLGNRYLTFVAFEIYLWIQSHTNPKIGGFFKILCRATLERSPSRLRSIYGKEHKTKQKKLFWTEISTKFYKTARRVFRHVIWLWHGGYSMRFDFICYPHPMAHCMLSYSVLIPCSYPYMSKLYMLILMLCLILFFTLTWGTCKLLSNTLTQPCVN